MQNIKQLLLNLLLLLLSVNVFSQQDYENYTYKLSSSTSDIEFWTTTPSNKVLKTDLVPTETGSGIKVYCAKNEFEPFLLVVNPQASLETSITIGEFSGLVETQLNMAHYTYLEDATDALGATGYFPDALKPIEFGQTISIPANENTAFWFTVKVAENATGATDYTTNIEINGISIPVTLHVFDFKIPDQLHIKSQMNFSHNTILQKYGVTGTGESYWNYVDMIKQYFIDHRLTPKSVLWSGGLTSGGAQPYIDYDCNGTLTDNDGIWGFEEPASRYLDGSGNMNGQFSEAFNGGTGFPSFMGATFMNNDPSVDQRPETFCGETRTGEWSNAGSAYNDKWFSYIAGLEDYLSSTGYLDKTYYYFANEPQDQDDYDAIAWYSQKLKSAAPNLKLMVSEEPRPEIYNHADYPEAKVDIWLPVLNHFDPEMSWDRDANYNEDTWVYFLHGTTPPYFNPITLDHDGVESKFTGWFLWKYRIRGLAYYSLTGWSQNPWTQPMTYGQNGNTFLLYPPSESNENIDFGANNHRMVPSMRLELLRDGFEDYEYLYTLVGGQPEVNVPNDADQQVDKIISGLTAYTRDPEFMYNLRRLIGLKNGGEISTIPDIQPGSGHWRTQGAPGNYYINFQDPDGLPETTSSETIHGETYSFYTADNVGYLQIGTNEYDENLGYGWYAPDDVHWMMQYDEWFEDHNDLQRSYIYSDWGRTGTFEFDLPSGNYDVTVSIGKRGSYSNQNVIVEGETVFEGEATNNECKTNTVNVSVNDSKLTLVMGDGIDYTFLNYMNIIATDQQGVNDLRATDVNVSVFPNPVDDILNLVVEMPEPRNHLCVSVYNMLGNKLMVLEDDTIESPTMNRSYNLDSKLSPGVYFLKIQSGDHIFCKKIVVR